MRKPYIRTAVVTALAMVAWISASRLSAAPFVNLDFEQSTVQPDDPQVVPAAAAFPGWTARVGTITLSTVYHSYTGAGEPVVAIFDRPNTSEGMRLLQGSFMGYVNIGTNGSPGSLSQSGDVPSDAQSMTLLCDGGQGPPIVLINGGVINTVFVSGGHGLSTTAKYGLDVTMFAGQTIQLELRSKAIPVFADRQSLDDVRFSTEPIPEPTLLLPSSLVLYLARRRHQPLKGRRSLHAIRRSICRGGT